MPGSWLYREALDISRVVGRQSRIVQLDSVVDSLGEASACSLSSVLWSAPKHVPEETGSVRAYLRPDRTIVRANTQLVARLIVGGRAIRGAED